MQAIPNNIVIFDGVCNLCNGFVQRLIKIDKSHKLQFVSLQSPVAIALLAQHHYNAHELQTVVFVKNGKLYIKSNAILAIAKTVGGLWQLLYCGKIIPCALRDYAYSYVASKRYKWFGKLDTCMMPTKELQERFL